MVDPEVSTAWRGLLDANGLQGAKLATQQGEEQMLSNLLAMESGVPLTDQLVEMVKGWIAEALQQSMLEERLQGMRAPTGQLCIFTQNQEQASCASDSLVAAVEAWVPPPGKKRRACLTKGNTEDETSERQEEENREHFLWSERLVEEMKRIQAPVLDELEGTIDPARAQMALAGKSRSGTIKRYLKTWDAFTRWLKLVKGKEVFPNAADLVDYMFARSDEPCGPSVPTSIYKAVSWFEHQCGIDDKNRLTTQSSVQLVHERLQVILGKDAPPIKRAPRIPVAFLEAWELVVVDTDIPEVWRIIAWVKLVKVWASLRFNDMQHVEPHLVKVFQGRMTTVLRQTKTSGPARRVRELPVCISEYAYIHTHEWFSVGWKLLGELADFPRDYLLPKINQEATGFLRRMASYTDMCAYSEKVFGLIRSQRAQTTVIPKVFQGFWTEHSERATLASALSILKVEPTERDMLGRWKPEGSETYMRTYNAVISRLQNTFALAASGRDRIRLLDEREISETALGWLKLRRGLDEETAKGLVSLLFVGISMTPKGRCTVLVDPESDAVLHVEDSESEREHAKKPRKSQAGYLLVQIKPGMWRLHKCGKSGCWMARDRDFKTCVEREDKPDPSEYSFACKLCWPELKGGSSTEEDSSGEA